MSREIVPAGNVPVIALMALAFIGLTWGLTGMEASAATSPRAREATSNITVVKTCPEPSRRAARVKPAKPADISGAEEHVVKPGEHLWELLRDRSANKDERHIARLYARCQRLNPGVDLKRLRPGQRLLLPAAQTRVARAGVAPLPGQEPVFLPTGGRTRAREAADQAAPSPGAEAPRAQKGPDKWGPDQATRRAKDAVPALFTELGEQVANKGRHYLPLPVTGQVVLDAEKFPVLQFSAGPKLIMDLEGRIPVEVDALLAGYQDYSILRLDPKKGLRGLIDDAIGKGGYQGVLREKPLVLEGPFRAELRSDWILLRNPDAQGSATQADLICYVTDPSQRTSPAVARHLAARGVNVLDIVAPEEGQVMVFRAAQDQLPAFEPPVVATGAREMVSNLLSVLGQDYRQDASLSVFGDESREKLQGFSLRVVPDFTFERGGQHFVVDVKGLGPQWVTLLEKRGFRVLALEDGRGGQAAAARLLSFLNAPYSQGATLMGSTRPAATNIRLDVPGLVVEASGKRYLILEGETDEGLTAGLYQQGLRVIQIK